MTTATLAFIGAGNMAGSIIGGLISNGYDPERIIASDPGLETLQLLKARFGIKIAENNSDAVREADVVILAVKPQVMKPVVTELAPALQDAMPMLVSIAAGITIDSLNDWSGGNLPIIRCMPNTPALVGCGASGLYANPQVSEAQKTLAETVMNAVGISQWLDSESAIDAVTALSGSGPAYFFLLMESMINAGKQLGLPPETATALTLQTALGAARMATEGDVEAAELRRRVTSPGGTTEQAINTFEQGEFRTLVQSALDAAERRSRELAKQD
ncbi:pyrroline-5-carboxylate reductase [Kistimonas scapharcae]|uniref:Pyrroline-5-carboxylate reductase n=1 Tax=Kistimonas scapharcae TaxID=1036133 RepID=A0ABP8V6W8_9GAMM